MHKYSVDVTQVDTTWKGVVSGLAGAGAESDTIKGLEQALTENIRRVAGLEPTEHVHLTLVSQGTVNRRRF